MFFSGIGDEAGADIDTQIRAQRELGWKHLELRLVDGANITQCDDNAFGRIAAAIDEAGLQISCLGSAIANWARPITCEIEIDRGDLKRAIPRMKRLRCPLIRVMSYPNHPEEPLSEREWRREAIARMKYLAGMAEDAGVTLVHENCSGWGGLSAANSVVLLGEVASPALKLVFDTGNPVEYGQDTWEYYRQVFPDIAYVHVKDGRRVNGELHYCYCGEGDGHVLEVLTDLRSRGYTGGVSIEPHLAAIIHTGKTAADTGQQYRSYIEYGRRLMALAGGTTSVRGSEPARK
jgi:sugar phosphate isomerase/epimerase